MTTGPHEGENPGKDIVAATDHDMYERYEDFQAANGFDVTIGKAPIAYQEEHTVSHGYCEDCGAKVAANYRQQHAERIERMRAATEARERELRKADLRKRRKQKPDIPTG